MVNYISIFSYGNFFVPNDIEKKLIHRKFEDRDVNIILEQFNNLINTEELDKIYKIVYYNIYKTEFGYYFQDFNLISENIQIAGIADESKKAFVTTFSPPIFNHLKSLYLFYNQNFYSHLLQKKYKFSTEAVETCESYPLNSYLDRPSQKLFKYDYCYIVCTK